MIRLLIDDQEVALPPDFSFTLYEENPVYTKNGQYTYDLTLSLKNFRNARIYGHIDRVNIKNGIQYNRSAVLWVDNKIRLNGTEIIIGFGNSDVKIVLASGNSELNFLIKGDTKLRDLQLGVAEVNPDTIKDDLDHPYPERNWLVLPFVAGNIESVYTGSGILNRWDFYFDGNSSILYYVFSGDTPYVSPTPEFGYYKNFRPQPYLCFIIDAVLKSLGYTLTFNSLAEHPVLKYMYIVHGFDTWEFAKMLPDWTVNEFFTKIETQFDCTFIINEGSKTAELYFKYDESIDKNLTLQIKDEYVLDIDEDNTPSIQKANIGYNIDVNEDDYYRYQKLDKSVKEAVKQGVFSDLGDLLEKINDQSDTYRLRKIYKEISSENEEVLAGSHFIASNTGDSTLPRKVDSFRDLIRNPEREEMDITFDILPAPMRASQLSAFYCQFPVVIEADPIVKKPDNLEEDFTPVQDLINGDNSVESITLPTKMYLALYSGRHDLITFVSGAVAEKYPMPYIEALSEFFVDNSTIYYFNSPDINPFRLEWLKENIYDKFNSIDTTKPYKFSFELKDDFNIRATFNIRNREFICTKIEKEITIDGFSKFATGYFYPKE